MRADALLKQGKEDEASRWLTTSFILLPGEFLYRALRLAKMHDAAGRHRLALDHYQRFLSLWQKADPGLQPAVTAVRRRIQELGQAASRS